MPLVDKASLEGNGWRLKTSASDVQLDSVPVRGMLAIIGVFLFVVGFTVVPLAALLALSWSMWSAQEFIPSLFTAFLATVLGGFALLPRLLSPLNSTHLVLKDRHAELDYRFLGFVLSRFILSGPFQVHVEPSTKAPQSISIDIVNFDGHVHRLASNLSHSEATQIAEALQQWMTGNYSSEALTELSENGCP